MLISDLLALFFADFLVGHVEGFIYEFDGARYAVVEDGVMPIGTKGAREDFRELPFVVFDSKHYEVKVIGSDLELYGPITRLMNPQPSLGGVSLTQSLSILSEALDSFKWGSLPSKSTTMITKDAYEGIPMPPGALLPAMTMQEVQYLFVHLRQVTHIWNRLFEKEPNRKSVPMEKWPRKSEFWSVLFDLALYLASVPLARWVIETQPKWDPKGSITSPDTNDNANNVSMYRNAFNDNFSYSRMNWISLCHGTDNPITRLLAWGRWNAPKYPNEPPRVPYDPHEDVQETKKYPRDIEDLLGTVRGSDEDDSYYFGRKQAPYVETCYTKQDVIDMLAYLTRELGYKPDSSSLPRLAAMFIPLDVLKSFIPSLIESGATKFHYHPESLPFTPTIQWLKIYIEDLKIIPPPDTNLLNEALNTWVVFKKRGTFQFKESFQYLLRLASPGWCQIAVQKNPISQDPNASSSQPFSGKKSSSLSSSSSISSLEHPIIDYGPPILVFDAKKEKIDLQTTYLIPAPPIIEINTPDAHTGKTLLRKFEDQEGQIGELLESKKLYLSAGGLASSIPHFAPPKIEKRTDDLISPTLASALLSGEMKRAFSLMKKEVDFVLPKVGATPIATLHSQLFYDLIRNNHLNALKLLHNRGYPLKRIYLRRHLLPTMNDLEQTWKIYEGSDDWPFAEKGDYYYPLLLEAVKSGNLEIVRFLREEAKCPWSYDHRQTFHFPLFIYSCKPRKSEWDDLLAEQKNSSGSSSTSSQHIKSASHASKSSSSSSQPLMGSNKIDPSVQMMIYLESQLVPPNVSSHRAMAYAIQFNNISAVKWLISRGIPLVDTGKWTALHAACIFGRTEIVKWIFETYGDEIAYYVDGDSNFAFDCAVIRRHSAIIAVFEDWFCSSKSVSSSSSAMSIKTSSWSCHHGIKPGPAQKGYIPSSAEVVVNKQNRDEENSFYPAPFRSTRKPECEYRYTKERQEYFRYVTEELPAFSTRASGMKLHKSFAYLEPAIPSVLAAKKSAFQYMRSSEAIDLMFWHAFSMTGKYDTNYFWPLLMKHWQNVGVDIMKVPIQVYQRTWMEFEPACTGAVSPTLEFSWAFYQQQSSGKDLQVAQSGCRHPNIARVTTNVLVALVRASPMMLKAGYRLSKEWGTCTDELRYPNDILRNYSHLVGYRNPADIPVWEECPVILILTKFAPDVMKDSNIISQLVIEAALVGSIPLLEWLIDYCNIGDKQDERYCYMMLHVAIYGTMNVLKWLVARGFPLSFSQLPAAKPDSGMQNIVNTLPSYILTPSKGNTSDVDLQQGIIKLSRRPLFAHAVVAYYGKHSFVDPETSAQISERLALLEEHVPNTHLVIDPCCYSWRTGHFLAYKGYSKPLTSILHQYLGPHAIKDDLGRTLMQVFSQFHASGVIM